MKTLPSDVAYVVKLVIYKVRAHKTKKTGKEDSHQSRKDGSF